MRTSPESGSEDAGAERRPSAALVVAVYYLPLVPIVLVAKLVASGVLLVARSPAVGQAAGLGVFAGLYTFWTTALPRLLPDVCRRPPPGARVILILLGLAALGAGILVAVTVGSAAWDLDLRTDGMGGSLRHEGYLWAGWTLALVVLESTWVGGMARRRLRGPGRHAVWCGWAGMNLLLTASAFATLRFSACRPAGVFGRTRMSVEPVTFLVGLGALCFSILLWVLLWRTARRSKA
jgi:hypothetical protein